MQFTIKIETYETVDRHCLKQLYKDCEWNWLSPDESMKDALKQSYRLFCAYESDQLVGFARVISDGNDPKSRRRGYGKALIETLTVNCKSSGLKVLQLLATKEGKTVYQKLGFTTCSEESPGMIKFLMNE
jgi:N-acetylglutamate synthase-like GNAT family acetyltransferase